MKKPSTIQEFKVLINAMCHRERFMFTLNNDMCYMEVYATETQNTQHLNICITIYDEKGKQKPLNRLIRLWNNDFYFKVYNLLK